MIKNINITIYREEQVFTKESKKKNLNQNYFFLKNIIDFSIHRC